MNNTTANKQLQKRPNSKAPSQPLTSKTGQSKHIVFGGNVPGANNGVSNGETISSGGPATDRNDNVEEVDDDDSLIDH